MHSEGQSLMASGAYGDAIQVFNRGLDEHGPNVGLLGDLAGCAYLKNDIGLFRRAPIASRRSFAPGARAVVDREPHPHLGGAR